MVYTEEQEILQEITKEDEFGTIKIKALAGTGKTTTLLGIAKQLPNKKIMYLVFSAQNKDEAVKKFPRNVKVMTVHGLAYGYLMGKKTKIDLENVVSKYKANDIKKRYDINIEDARNVLEVLNQFNISGLNTISEVEGYQEHIKETAKKVFGEMIRGEMKPTFDFYLKYYELIVKNKEVKAPYDIIMLDEAQTVHQ